MEPIALPEVLDPERTLTDDREEMTGEEHRARAQRLDAALHESCEYGQQLWKVLDEVRAYLMGSLPPDPRSPEAPPVTCASPTGPDDEEGWSKWIGAFAAVTSALAGPRGDSGYGVNSARHAASVRRSAPVVQVNAKRDLAKDAPAVQDSATGSPPHPDGNRLRIARAAALGVLVSLAVRGVLPRRVVDRG